MVEISHEEAVTVGAFVGFGALWVAVIVPYMTSVSWFYTLNPVIAYLAYNLGWIFLTSAVFGGAVSLLLLEEDRIWAMVRLGVASWLFVSLTFDMLEPPFYLSTTGQVLIPLGTNSLENTAVDAAFAWVWQHALGSLTAGSVFGISVLYILVYAVTPVLGIVGMALLLAPNQFMKFFGDAI